LTVFTLFVLFSFLAFSIDTGYLAGARAEMRRSADAASLAGCWELYQHVKAGSTPEAAQPAARAAAAQYVAANRVANSDMAVDTDAQSQDVRIGYLDSLTSGSTISSNSALPFMAVQVSLLKSPEHNGEVPFFFGKIFGNSGQTMETSATAVMAQSISGFTLPPGSSAHLPLLPFALDEDTWNAMQAGLGEDKYYYDEDAREVKLGCDGIREGNLYPQGTGSPGNRGTVDIGGSNNSTADIARQISQGISAADLAELGKPLAIGSDGTLTLNGDTGISAGVKDEFAGIIGQTRILPIFSKVCGNGNNATYTITKWANVRVLAVKLTGQLSSKKVMVQAAPPMVCPYVTVGTSVNTSSGIFSPVLLTR
jgi:hypothetical protein